MTQYVAWLYNPDRKQRTSIYEGKSEAKAYNLTEWFGAINLFHLTACICIVEMNGMIERKLIKRWDFRDGCLLDSTEKLDITLALDIT